MKTMMSMMLSVVLLTAVFAGGAWAQGTQMTSQQKVAFKKLVAERDALHRKLVALDRAAAEQIKRGQDPVMLHAQQVSTQDQLDLVTLKLEIQAARFGVAIPQLPAADHTPDAGVRARVMQSFARGKSRAVGQVREQTLGMLASIDFKPFLNQMRDDEAVAR